MGRKRKKYPNVKKINQEELQDLLSRARQNSLTEDDCNHIEDMANTIGYIIDLLPEFCTQLYIKLGMHIFLTFDLNAFPSRNY